MNHVPAYLPQAPDCRGVAAGYTDKTAVGQSNQLTTLCAHLYTPSSWPSHEYESLTVLLDSFPKVIRSTRHLHVHIT